jgi:hypothetical protein
VGQPENWLENMCIQQPQAMMASLIELSSSVLGKVLPAHNTIL